MLRYFYFILITTLITSCGSVSKLSDNKNIITPPTNEDDRSVVPRVVKSTESVSVDSLRNFSYICPIKNQGGTFYITESPEIFNDDGIKVHKRLGYLPSYSVIYAQKSLDKGFLKEISVRNLADNNINKYVLFTDQFGRIGAIRSDYLCSLSDANKLGEIDNIIKPISPSREIEVYDRSFRVIDKFSRSSLRLYTVIGPSQKYPGYMSVKNLNKPEDIYYIKNDHSLFVIESFKNNSTSLVVTEDIEYKSCNMSLEAVDEDKISARLGLSTEVLRKMLGLQVEVEYSVSRTKSSAVIEPIGQNIRLMKIGDYFITKRIKCSESFVPQTLLSLTVLKDRQQYVFEEESILTNEVGIYFEKSASYSAEVDSKKVRMVKFTNSDYFTSMYLLRKALKQKLKYTHTKLSKSEKDDIISIVIDQVVQWSNKK